MSTPVKILNAIISLVSTPPIDGVKVFRQLSYAIPSEKERAIVNIKLSQESAPVLYSAPTKLDAVADRTVDLLVEIVARGDDALEQCERLRIEMSRRILTDETLGGLAAAVDEGGVMRDDEDMDGSMMRATTIFSVKYRTLGVDDD